MIAKKEKELNEPFPLPLVPIPPRRHRLPLLVVSGLFVGCGWLSGSMDSTGGSSVLFHFLGLLFNKVNYLDLELYVVESIYARNAARAHAVYLNQFISYHINAYKKQTILN